MAIQVRGTKELERRLKAIGMTPHDALRKIQLDAVANAKRAVPRKTGRLGRSIGPGGLTNDHAIVRASANYAAYVELGTRPHVIKPRNGKFLAFPAKGTATRLGGAPTRDAVRKGGAYVFARVVHHPGTKPQPFLVPGAQQAIKDNLGADVIIRDWNRAA